MAGIALAAWSAVASVVAWLVYLETTAFPASTPAAWFVWWRMLAWWNADHWAQVAIYAGAAVATIIGILLAVLIWPLRPQTKQQPLYGATEWAGRGELDRGGFRQTRTPL